MFIHSMFVVSCAPPIIKLPRKLNSTDLAIHIYSPGYKQKDKQQLCAKRQRFFNLDMMLMELWKAPATIKMMMLRSYLLYVTEKLHTLKSAIWLLTQSRNNDSHTWHVIISKIPCMQKMDSWQIQEVKFVAWGAKYCTGKKLKAWH